MNVECEVEINVKAVLVYFKGDVAGTKKYGCFTHMNQTNQYSFTT